MKIKTICLGCVASFILTAGVMLLKDDDKGEDLTDKTSKFVVTESEEQETETAVEWTESY